jgi:hypothetical protein
MSFVCEEIPESDIQNYALREVNQRLHCVGFGNGWVIDRQRNIYLRWIRTDRENRADKTFTFFWKGTLLTLRIDGVSTSDADNAGGTTWTLPNPDPALPPELETHRAVVIGDLRDALTAYRSYGLSSSIDPHTATFNF